MNHLVVYPIPNWVFIAFLVTIPLPFILIFRLVSIASKRLEDHRPAWWVGLFFTSYIAYIYGAWRLNWFDVVSFPPRVLLLTTFPYALLLFGVLLRLAGIEKILAKIDLHQLIGLHVFRVVGVFFILLANCHALPPTFAYIAGAGDLISAISSVFVARAVRNRQPYARTLAMAWNFFGAADIAFTAIGANVLTKISIETGSMGVDTLAQFPYCIIPAFAPPTILWLHWVIYKKLRALR